MKLTFVKIALKKNGKDEILYPDFLNHSTTDISDHIILHLGEESCAMEGVSHTPRLYPVVLLPPTHHLPVMKMSPDIPKCSLGVGSPEKYCRRHIYTKNIIHCLSEIKM